MGGSGGIGFVPEDPDVRAARAGADAAEMLLDEIRVAIAGREPDRTFMVALAQAFATTAQARATLAQVDRLETVAEQVGEVREMLAHFADRGVSVRDRSTPDRM